MHLGHWTVVNQDLPETTLSRSLFHGLETPRILVIRFARMGDLLLLVPTLKALRNSLPRAKISVLVGHRCAPILEMCSAVDEVISVDRVAMRDGSKLTALGEIFRLAENIRRRQFDLVLDLHSFRETNLLTWYSRAPMRLGLKRAKAAFLPFCFNLDPIIEDKTLHVCSVFLASLEALGLNAGQPDCLLDLSIPDLESARLFFEQNPLAPGTRLVGMYIGASSPGRRWPLEKFAELARLLSQVSNIKSILFWGPREQIVTRQLEESFPPSSRTLVAGSLPLRQMASLMSNCDLLISNDTGPMHLGPAVGVPTLGLFSLSLPEHYHPIGPSSQFIKRESIDKIGVEEVHRMAAEMLGLT